MRRSAVVKYETTFGTALKEFVRLKRLAVTRDSLVGDGEDKEPQPLHETLPPNLEEAWILLGPVSQPVNAGIYQYLNTSIWLLGK
jgi:hypothetical protein